ncbi:DUF4186 family protein [Nocardia sp. CA-107356]|uniref:DUF4186 family protein n=1 Tax=Nocardia sp. CA-107356 TaxID=3239972 RepID=UPI003D8B6CF6
MGTQVNPCITFNGNARQALEFYREVFGGELEVDALPGHPVFVAQHATATCCRTCWRVGMASPPGKRSRTPSAAMSVPCSRQQ